MLGALVLRSENDLDNRFLPHNNFLYFIRIRKGNKNVVILSEAKDQ